MWRETQQTYSCGGGGGSIQLIVSFSYAGADASDSGVTSSLIEPLLQLVERGYPDEASLALLRRLRLVLVPRNALSLRADMLGVNVSSDSPDGPLAVPLVNLVWQLFQHPLPLFKAPPSRCPKPERADRDRASSPSGASASSFLFYSTPYNEPPRNPTPNETACAAGPSCVRPVNRFSASVREELLEASPTAASAISDSEQLISPSNKRRRVGASPRTGREAGEAAEANAPSDATTRFLEFACK